MAYQETYHMAKKQKFSRTKNTILNLLTGLGGNMLVNLLKFITRTVFIRTLGTQYLGIGGLFSNILTMLSLTELGMDTAINFRLYKPVAEWDVDRIRVLMKFYRTVYRLIGCVVFLLGISLVPALPVLIKDYDKLDALGINAVLIFMMYLMRSVTSYLFLASRTAIIKADQKRYVLSVVDYFINIASYGAEILILLVWKNFVLYTGVALLFGIIKNFVNASIAKKMYPEVFQPTKDRITRQELKEMLKDCGALFVYKVNSVVLKATDNLVLSAFIGLAIVGLYSNYLMIYKGIKGFINKFYTAARASVGNYFATKDLPSRYRFFEVMNFMTAVLYGTACVGIAVCSNEVITAWIGEEFLIPQPFPILIGIEILFAGLKHNLGQIRNLSGAFRQLWYRPITSIFVNLGVSVTLVQVIGIYGVIIGTITADALTNFMVDPRIIHRFSFENYKPVSVYYRRNFCYIAILITVGIFDAWLCSWFLTGYGWLSVFVHVILVGCSVPAAFILLYWNSEECKYLVALLKNILKKIQKRGGRAK